jgi:hypothetical protein
MQFAAQTEIPIFGNLLGQRYAVRPGCGPVLPATNRCGAMPVAAVDAPVNLDLST